MARYTVLYRGEGTFVERDARWFKVSVLKEHQSLGIALGIIAEPDWEDELPGGGDGPAVMANAAVRLLAIKIQETVEAGQFRNRWEIGAAEFTLDGRDARHLVNSGVAEPHRYSPDSAVAFFQGA
ncbi:MAG TPA: hypothetical protein VHT30_06895 [Acidimicrobiales bacterium]|jgi:hypothetical protein|nr:hypothetical protein [Acidimicrobiales bacterium]